LLVKQSQWLYSCCSRLHSLLYSRLHSLLYLIALASLLYRILNQLCALQHTSVLNTNDSHLEYTQICIYKANLTQYHYMQLCVRVCVCIIYAYICLCANLSVCKYRNDRVGNIDAQATRSSLHARSLNIKPDQQRTRVSAPHPAHAETTPLAARARHLPLLPAVSAATNNGNTSRDSKG